MNRRGLSIGPGQARRLCQMAYDERLAFLAEGLPVILSSAQSMWRGSRKLEKKMPREAGVLRGFAEEEAAKALIFMDAVRCPRHLVASRMGAIVGWSYDHLARLIYAEAIQWSPGNVAELREYVDSHRKAHVLEGDAGEYIVPNWSLYERASRLYADIQAGESGDLAWSDPVDSPFSSGWERPMPHALLLAEAMAELGIFTHEGLKATSEVWGQVEFAKKERRADAIALARKLVTRLIQEGLPSETATKQQHLSALGNYWQLPMYSLDFKMIPVSLQELEAAREVKLGWLL